MKRKRKNRSLSINLRRVIQIIRLNSTILLVTTIFTSLALSCNAPNREYRYKALKNNEFRIGKKGVDIPFYIVDSTKSHTLYICARFKKMMLRSNNFLVKVELSHLGNRYLIDTISLYTNTIKEYSNNSGSYLDIEWPYRENITTNKLGEWVLTITPLNSTTDYSPIDGFGVRCTKEDTYEFKR